MKFFIFYQNNSSGHFIKNSDLDEYVVIQAENNRDANDKAEDLGIYFDGVRKGIDCECCGDRWNEVGINDARDTFSFLDNCKCHVEDEYRI